MEKFVKVMYIIIILIFLLTVGALGWYIMDTKKETEIEMASLRNQLNEVTLSKSEMKPTTPEEVRIIKEYDYTSPTEGQMKITAFDCESKVVWSYKSEKTSIPEYDFDMLWPHYECVYSLEYTKIVILNAFTGEKRAQVNLESNENAVAAGFYKGDIYVLTQQWSEGGTQMTQKICKIDNDGHIIASKALASSIYDGFDQTIERVDITRIDESEIEIFVTRYDKENIEFVTSRDF